MVYHVDETRESYRGAELVAVYLETRRLRLVVRNDRYLVWNDSVTGVSTLPGSTPVQRRVWPEDTVRYFVRLSRLGEILESVPECDPAVPECRAALPSALPLELRRIVPRLPVWWPPRGHGWVDTLAFDDLPRARGVRGSEIRHYRTARDTVLSGRAYWVVTWRSVRRAVRQISTGATTAVGPVEEQGVVYVDKARLIPACAVWSEVAPPETRAPGGAALRGRADLVGSGFDSVVVAR